MAGKRAGRHVAVRVGAALSLSGRYAAQGEQARRGLALWVEDVNAAGGLLVRDRGARLPLELLVYDDASHPGQSAAYAERLLSDDQVALLFGPYSSVLALAVAPVAERHRKVLWNHGGATDAVGRAGFRWVVSLLSPASQYFVAILAMVRAYAPAARRVALAYGPRGTFPRAVCAGAMAYAPAHGFAVVLHAPYPPTEAALPALVEAIVARRAAVVLGVGELPADLAFARQLRLHGVRAPVLGVVAAAVTPFQQVLGAAAEGFVGPSQWEPGARYQPDVGPTSAQFAARFHERFGQPPDYPAAQAYAAGLIAQACVERAGTLADAALRAAAETLALTTFYGAFRLDPATGAQVGHQLLVVQWQGGAKRIVWPPALAEAPFRLPTAS
ncbi:MAG TPA: amino acid ABC transporter substrate-binding protein [Chloroflexota bacterium]|nr:amino acid ABC transporter substrate-binding protein [Chloroflexota bacterium]